MKRAILFLIFGLPFAAAASGPEALIRDTSDKVLAEIRNNASTYQEDPQRIYQLVDDVVLPHFDFSAMTDLALGRHEADVAPEQKPVIVAEFRQLLVRTYASALLEYNDQQVIFLPLEGSEADGEVVVRTEIEQQGGFPIPIDYRLRQGDGGWKVIDISVDEVSLVTNYRSSFARAIKKDGVDGLIQTLRERNRQSQ